MLTLLLLGFEFIRFPKKERRDLSTLESIESTEERSEPSVEELGIPPEQRKVLENSKAQCEKFIEIIVYSCYKLRFFLQINANSLGLTSNIK